MSSRRVILSVEKPSSSSTGMIIRRFSAKVFLPSTETVEIKDVAAVLAETKPTVTRSGSLIAVGGVEGKVCVCETKDTVSLKHALLYATKGKALAIIATKEPNQMVTVPTVLISFDQLRRIKGDLPGGIISLAYTTGSYETFQTTLVLQRMGVEEGLFDGRIHVPIKTTDHLVHDQGWTYKAVLLRTREGKIVEFLKKDDIAGNMCLVEGCKDDHDFAQVVKLSGQYGAVALITTYEDPPLQDIPLPVVVVKRSLFRQMNQSGMKVFFKYKSNARKRLPSLESPAPPAAPSQSWASVVQDGSKSPPNRQPQTKLEDNSLFGMMGNAITNVGRSIGVLRYTPKSNEKFKAIVAAGADWSKDVRLYYDALDILKWIDTIKKVEDRRAEREVLNGAIGDMISDHKGRGDILMVAFCAKLRHLLPPETSWQLLQNAVKLIQNIKLDGSKSVSFPLDSNRNDLDKFVVELVKYLSTQALSGSSLKSFVVNALWIQVHQCQSFKIVRWNPSKSIRVYSIIMDERETLLTFMTLAQFNTLAMYTATSFQDICAFFSGESKVSVLRMAIKSLQRLYKNDKTTRMGWQNEFGQIKECNAITLLDRFEVENGDEKMTARTDFIKCTIERIEHNRSRSFSDFDCVYNSLQIDSQLFDVTTEMMIKSICSLLRDRSDVPSPASVSELLQTDISRCLLLDQRGVDALKYYVEQGLFKSYGEEKKKLVLLGESYSSFLQSASCSKDDASTSILNAIRNCIRNTQDHYGLCLSAMDVSQHIPDIFCDGEDPMLPSLIGGMIVRESCICSTVRSSPSMLSRVTSHLHARTQGQLSHFLYQELVTGLKKECEAVESALSVYESVLEGDIRLPSDTKNIVYEIILSSFRNKNPSCVEDLINFTAPIMKKFHGVLVIISTDESCGEIYRMESNACLDIIRSIGLKWCEQFKKDKLNREELQTVNSILTNTDQEVLTNILGSHFPSSNEIGEKIAEMEGLIETTRSSMHFSVARDDDAFTISISDLETHYRIKKDHPLFQLIPKYLSTSNPDVDLSSIRRESKYIVEFMSSYEKELQAASHFRFFRSALFQNEIGVWTEIHLDVFLAKISASLQKLECLLSPAATFSSVSGAAGVLESNNVEFDCEMRAIVSLLDVDDGIQEGLNDVMTLAKLAKQLGNFVECCQMYKFAFRECDECFHDLRTICNQMNGDEGKDWDVAHSLAAGRNIVQILSPKVPASTELDAQLQQYRPVIDFFDALLHCSSVFDLAREKGWFGKKGLSTFYQEYENVTNVLNQKQSYEMEVLNRLEPTIQCISALGGNLECESVATLLDILSDTDHFSRQNITAMKTIQENIYKILDWLSEGMDDMAAIHGKFALIQSSGRVVISSDDSMGEATLPKRDISLHFFQSDGSKVIMNAIEVRELVQHLGFTTHDSDESRMEVERFVRVYEHCSKVKECQQTMADVGFGGDDVMNRLEFILSEDSEDLALRWLDEVGKMIEDCEGWLGRLRKRNRFSLLFWGDELRSIYQCMRNIRNREIDEESTEWQLLMSMISKMTLKADCSDLIAQYASEDAFDGSWLEDVSVFVSKCGEQDTLTSSLGENGIVIHKVDCLDGTIYAAQLRLLYQVYKNRRPSSFEYLDASCIKSQEHVAMFLERVLLFPEHRFVIAHVEQLAASEQELIANFIARHAKMTGTIQLHCIQFTDTVLYAAPGVSICSWNDTTLSEHHLSPWLQDCVAFSNRFSDITVVFSENPGTGKTRFIRSELERARVDGAQTASIYIHEDFSLTRVVEQLRENFGESGLEDRSIHFGLPSHTKPSNEFLLSLNHFFNTFLLTGNVYDPASGNTFYGSPNKWNVFVEMSTCVEDEDAALSWLCRNIPILSYYGSQVRQPPPDFCIDEKARRVATYLRAYDDGTIDRQFNPTPKTILFVLDRSGSMLLLLDDRSRFDVALESMLSVFNSHIQIMDSVGLILFDHNVDEAVPLQRIESDQDLIRVHREMSNVTIEPDGGTALYSALRRGLESIDSLPRGQNEDVWVVCLTDGAAADKPNLVNEQLHNTADNLNIILIGIGLGDNLHPPMRDVCNKYGIVDRPNNRGIFIPAALNVHDIQLAFQEVASRIPVSQTFELDGAMSDEQCRGWLDSYRPQFISPENKLLYSFWVNFIYRRVSVFDASEDFNYNETHDSLGSSLMQVMLDESEQMLMRDQTDNSWSLSKHTQLIYDFSQPDSPKFRLICTSPDDLDPVQREKLEQLDLPGFSIPNVIELRRRETLDRYLSQALSIPLSKDRDGNECLQCVNDHKFVLTLDFTLKLLNIHEHVSCGTPCVMEGETGVSKTALTRMYSILVNSQQMSIASTSTMETLQSILHELSTSFPEVVHDNYGHITERILAYLVISSQHTPTDINRAARMMIENLRDATSDRSDLFVDMPSSFTPNGREIDELAHAKEMLGWFSESHLEQLFFDINIHASLTADEMNDKFREAKRVARKVTNLDVKVVVFLDEINTASVLGLIKEIIVDRTLNGDPLEENIVIIGACNPVRKSSLTQTASNRVSDLGREWVSGHYQVKQLPPSLSTICWDFGALKREQEKEFIQQRILMMDENLPSSLTSRMTEILSSSHEFIRELATGHIMESTSLGQMHESEAILRARSVVSLRDIQRVFHLTDYFLNQFDLDKSNLEKSTHPFRRAMLVSVAIVYYLRLDASSRKVFVQKLQNLPTEMDEECGLLDALTSAMDTVVRATEIPEGVSLTLGLKENIFVTLVCTLARVPLMIVGPPGCSKTLAVSIVNDNANGEESPSQYYRNLARIQPFHYQCSKSSTSNEVASVFSRAEQRQSTVDKKKQQCLVFMDEAGLPEEERESLKVLHYLLEGLVAFVCIANHILDAAKSNRCVCLFRPEPDMEELSCISTGVLGQKLQVDNNIVKLVCFNGQMLDMKVFSERMCSCYMELMKDTDRFSFFVEFFGLRDFIHFLKFLRRSAPPVNDSILHVSEEVFVHAMERNFNGIDKEKFTNMCAYFVAKGSSSCDQIPSVLEQHIRDPMDVIHDALSEVHTNDVSRYNLPRYKMIIDHTNDDSVTRLLQIAGVLNSSHAFYKLSGIDEGADIEKLNLVSRVKFAAQYGKKTVVLSQVEGVSECFYDLFNQHFKEFRKEDGEVSYFANIAIGGVSRPCMISPSFQCIVHVQAAQLDELPAPFLNRFEKFQLNLADILSWKLKQLSPGFRDIFNQSLAHSRQFIQSIGGASGVWSPCSDDTLKSVYIGLMRHETSAGHTQAEARECDQSIAADVLRFILNNFNVELSVEDIRRSIDSARVEYRNSKDGMELDRVINCVSKSKATLLFEEVRNGCLQTPLSRVLKQIIMNSITRYAVKMILRLVRPDSLYLQRYNVDSEVLEIYFGEQEHFSLKRLVRNVCASHGTSDQFHIIYARSDICSHSLPTWSNMDGVDTSTLTRVRNLVHDDPRAVEIHHLDLLKSESEIRTTFDSWVSKVDVDAFILVVDMKLQSTNIVNFIRSYVEQATALLENKHFFLLLHFPLSCGNTAYPALFLGKWRCTFLDGIGDTDGNSVDFNNVLQSACSLTNQTLNADSLLDALKPKALQYVASQVPFYSCSKQPDSINQAMTLTARMVGIEHILATKVEDMTLGAILSNKFIAMWTNDRIREVVYRSAYSLASGNSKLSFSSALASTLQSSFNKCLAKCVLELNVWANLDCLADVETHRVFALALNSLSLPGMPLQELLLIRDMAHPLQPLPIDTRRRNVDIVFPFFFQISSLIEMAIDSSNFDFLDQSSLEQNDGFSQLFLERINSTIDQMADNQEALAGAVRDIVTLVAESNSLFRRYLQHILVWSLGAKNLMQVEKWIMQKMEVASLLDESLHCNILYLHILCRKNVGVVARISSWDSEHIAKELLRDELHLEGIDFVSALVGHFRQLVVGNFEATKWSHTFSIFLQSFPSLMEGGKVEDGALVSNLRLLILLNVLISVSAEEDVVMKITHLIVSDEEEITTASRCLELLKEANTHEDVGAAKDVQGQLLQVFFSQWWLRLLPDEVYHSDAAHLISSIKRQEEHFTGQIGVVHLRNVLTSRREESAQFALPSSSFFPSILILISSELNVAHQERFSESGDRFGMPNFVPEWLSTEGVSTPLLRDEPLDEVGWYFRNYCNNFEGCPLASAISDILLRELIEKAGGITSDELLIMFQASILEQKEVNQAANARLLRCSGQTSLQGPVSVKGCYVRALETDAILLTFVCKVAEELSAESRSFALEGSNALVAERILNQVMPQFRWADLFFKMIMRLGGEGHLANLLSDGEPLNNFQWCQQWVQGLSSHQRDAEMQLTRAENALREAQNDEEAKVQQFRRCPHCNQMFEVGQRNCGAFQCGRDAHAVGGQPAIGGVAVRGGYGCGRDFQLEQSIPYATDEARLGPLREEVRVHRISFEASNQGAALWARAERFDIPPLSFQLRNEEGSRMAKNIFSTSLITHLGQNTERENIFRLATIIDQLPGLEHVSCLPDMIELYIFVHKTFRHVVTREQSFNMKLCDIMDERLLKARFGVVHASHLHDLWMRVVEKFNFFLSANDSRVAFDCEDVTVPIDDLMDVTLIQVLSEADHPSNGHDALFLVINDLLMRYNRFIIAVSSLRNIRSTDDQDEEIHPRSLVRGSKNSVAVKALTGDIASTLANLIESHWQGDSFAVDALLRDIRREFDIIGSLQTVMAPLSFLRERFVFRDSFVGSVNVEANDQCFYSPNKQFYFAQRDDWMLYEDVRDKALLKCSGDRIEGSSCGIRQKMIITFQRFGHGEWTSLLEGMRNTLSGMDFSNVQEYGEAIESLGIETLQEVGFPPMDGAGSDLVRTLSEDDIVEFIDICGEQLSSEAYQFNRLPNRLSEPIPSDVRDSLERNVDKLLQTKQYTEEVHRDIQAFCHDILAFYEQHIVTVSEQSNEPFEQYLRRNNAWDNSDGICTALPSKLGIRNYIDLRKIFQQLQLKLRHAQHGKVELDSELPPETEALNSKEWKWVAPPSSDRVTDEGHRSTIFDSLWFEEAIKLNDDTRLSSPEEEKDQLAMSDCNGSTALSEDSIEDPNESAPDLEVERVEDAEEIVEAEDWTGDAIRFEDDDNEGDNIEEHHAAEVSTSVAQNTAGENQLDSGHIQDSLEVPVEGKKRKEYSMTPILVITLFLMSISALIYFRGLWFDLRH